LINKKENIVCPNGALKAVNSGRVQESTLCFCKDLASIYVTAAKTTAFIGARIREPKIHSRIL
jgi:hypothetical protein